MTYNNITSNGINYKVTPSGTAYHIETTDSVVNALETARLNRTRIRVYLGDTVTGKCWNDEHDIMGYIGRSIGQIKIPLLIYNERSHGGGGLLDHCILKIKESKGEKVLYQAANFIPSVFEIKASAAAGYTHSLYINGELYSNHKTLKSAETLKNKMQ